MRKWEKMIWAILCGAALGVSGCGEDGQPEYGAPIDTSTDNPADVSDDAAEDVVDDEMPAGAYGPAPSP